MRRSPRSLQRTSAASGSSSTWWPTTPPTNTHGSRPHSTPLPAQSSATATPFRDGKGPAANAHGSPGQWYLHTFAPEQPDLNWHSEWVHESFEEILRFWFDRGVDGIRIDAAAGFAKTPGLPDADYGGDDRFRSGEWVGNPHWDTDDVHKIFKRWRRVAEEYGGDRLLVAEAVVASPERLARYLAADEIHTDFNFEFLKVPWGEGLREMIDEKLRTLDPVGAPATWVLGSHDEVRLATRYGRLDSSSEHGASPDIPSDLELGARRLRAAVMLMLALPGTTYLYQGDELGLPSVDDIPEDRLQDPSGSGADTQRGVATRAAFPSPGKATNPLGFSPDDATSQPWLPQPPSWADGGRAFAAR
jgi:alpha-glucosidase